MRKVSLSRRKVSIQIKRGDAILNIEDVPGNQAFDVIAVVLDGFRKLAKDYHEVTDPVLESVGGYTTVEVPHDGDDETPPETGRNPKKVGFR